MIERLPSAERDAVSARPGRAALDAVDAFLPVGWHPMALHMRLSDMLRDFVGPERNVPVWDATMAACFGRPLLRGFIDTGTSLFGITPHSLLRQVERIYGQITRDIGVRPARPEGGSRGRFPVRNDDSPTRSNR